MEESCVCPLCGELVELSDLNFYVENHCDCVGGSCSHGICNDCVLQFDYEEDTE